MHNDKITAIGFVPLNSNGERTDTLQCSIGMESFLVVYSLRELKKIFRINVGGFPSHMIIIQNKYMLFHTKSHDLRMLNIITNVGDVITSDLEMNIKRTYLNSWDPDQQRTCIKHMVPRSNLIFSKINISNISAVTGNPNGMMIAFANGYPSLIGFDGK